MFMFRPRTPPGKDRYSVGFFLDPNPDATASCLPTYVGPDTNLTVQTKLGALSVLPAVL